MFPFFPKRFWIPPLICGVLATGCAVSGIWNARSYYQFMNSEEPDKNSSDVKESKTDTEKEKNSEENTDKNTKDNQMDRVIEIMKASAEGTKQILSDIFKDQ